MKRFSACSLFQQRYKLMSVFKDDSISTRLNDIFEFLMMREIIIDYGSSSPIQRWEYSSRGAYLNFKMIHSFWTIIIINKAFKASSSPYLQFLVEPFLHEFEFFYSFWTLCNSNLRCPILTGNDKHLQFGRWWILMFTWMGKWDW